MKKLREASRQAQEASEKKPDSPLATEDSWNYVDFKSWTHTCVDGEFQSPIEFAGARPALRRDIHMIDIFPSVKTLTSKFELTSEGRILKAKGEFLKIVTRRLHANLAIDHPIERLYKVTHIEVKTPCEHKAANFCDLELQFWSTEDVDYVKGDPIETHNHLVLSLMFLADDVGSSFTDGFFVEEGEEDTGKKQVAFLNALARKESTYKNDSEFKVDILKALQIASVVDKKDPEFFQTFWYEGSKTHPGCEENVHWYVPANNYKISPKVINILKQKYLNDPLIFKDQKNARPIQKSPKINFQMIDLTLQGIIGQKSMHPIFIKRKPVRDVKVPDFSQHTIVLSCQSPTHSSVIEVFEQYFTV